MTTSVTLHYVQSLHSEPRYQHYQPLPLFRAAPPAQEADDHPAGPGPLLRHAQDQPRPLRGAQRRPSLEGTRTGASQGKGLVLTQITIRSSKI